MRRSGRLVMGLVLTGLLLGRPAAAAMDHAAFDTLLKQHVRDGLVDYPAFQNNAAFTAYLNAVAAASLEGWTVEERIAFYLNAYNASVIQGIVSHWPVTQVIGIKGFFDGLKHEVAGQSVTLDDLENQLIRPFGDARVHAALVGGAKGAPALRGEAYQADQLDRQLEDQARRWANDPARVRLDKPAGKLFVPMTFRWYPEDFEGLGGPAGFLRQYRQAADDQQWLAAGDYQLEYQKFNWDLNQQ